jgi:hypothetical protein
MVTFTKILDLCLALSQELSDVVFIGGVAVYLHAIKKASKVVPPESSHDADFMVSFTDYGILKDTEEVTPTPRLAKHQMVVDGVEFDVYVERLCRLVVPYDEVRAHSVLVEEIRVACLEHLLVLKLEAMVKRGHTTKGEKDRRDVAKVGLMLGDRLRMKLIEPYMRDELLDILGSIAKSSVFYELCDKNVHQAKVVRRLFEKFLEKVRG